MSTKVKIRGKDKLFQKLKRSVPELEKELTSALEQNGNEMVAKARSFVPRDEGHLDRSIEWQYTQNTIAGEGSRSPAIVVMAGDEKGGLADHARHVEFGTSDTMRQPFFYPAYRLLRRKMKGRLTRSMTKAMKKAGLK